MTFKTKSYINIRLLLKLWGWLLLIESAFMLIPTITSFIYKEDATISFLGVTIFTALSGLLLKYIKTKSNDMGKREAILLTSSVWIVFTLFGMLPFLLVGTHDSITDAFFETMSGFTTTGASVLTSVESLPRGILIWRCIIQWIGGLGIILFTLAILPMLNNQGGIQLFNAEVTGITHDKLRPRISASAKGLWLVYIILTIILIVLLSFSEMTLFDSICHGLSTMSTGGFSTHDQSIGAWNSIYVKSVVCVFMFLGGINFSLLYKVSLGNFIDARKNDALKWYVLSILISYVLLVSSVCLNSSSTNLKDIFLDPLFQTVSIISSTGLTEPDFLNWGSVSVIILIIMMFMGACAGSTSGGAKIDRIIVLVKYLRNEFYKIMRPNAVTTVRINGRGTPTFIVQKTLAFLFLYILIIIIGGVLLSLCGLSLKDSFFCCLSAISNTGLGTESTGIANSYELIPDFGKWILSFIMLVGRLELYTILLLFTSFFWKK